MNAALLTSLTLVLSSPSDPCRSGDLPNDALDARIAKAESLIDEHDGDMDLWFGGVFGLHAAVMVGALVIANESDDDGLKKEMYVAAFGSGLGILTLGTGRPPLIDADHHLAGAHTKAERLAVLEYVLHRSARKVRFAQSWIAHLGSFIYGLGASLVLWFALDRKRAAITQFVGGQLIGQGRILLQPTGVTDAWDTYRGEFLPGCGEPVVEHEAETSALAIEPAGFGVQLRW